MKKYFFVPFFLVILLLFSCGKNDNPVGVTNKNFTYPLKRGNQWDYNGHFYFFNIRGDSTVLVGHDTTFFDISVEIRRQELLPNNILAYALHENVVEHTPLFGDISSESEAYYNNFEDGLFLYGYKGGSNVIPKRNPAGLTKSIESSLNGVREMMVGLQPGLLKTNMVQQDTLYLVQPASKSLQYPMAPGNSWTHNTNTGTIKRVLEVIDVEVPAGTFECVKVEWVLGSNLELLDYIAAQGLIKRTAITRNVTITSQSNPDGIGVTVDVMNEYFLKSLNIEN